MRAAIYARVSKNDGSQDPVNQLAQLCEYCARQRWTIENEYIDQATGKTASRDAFKKLFTAASRRRLDVVLVWALDRFTPEGVLETFKHVERLRDYGVQFESYTEPHFRTTGPAGELMLAVSASIAKQERLRISERTRAGLDSARKKGKVLGRSRVVCDRSKVAELRAAGASWTEIENETGLSRSTVRRIAASSVQRLFKRLRGFRTASPFAWYLNFPIAGHPLGMRAKRTPGSQGSLVGTPVLANTPETMVKNSVVAHRRNAARRPVRRPRHDIARSRSSLIPNTVRTTNVALGLLPPDRKPSRNAVGVSIAQRSCRTLSFWRTSMIRTCKPVLSPCPSGTR